MLTFQSGSARIQGEFFLGPGICAVAGLSGAGKTSLFRLMAGLDGPEGTALTVEGRSLENVPSYQRPIAYVPQRPSLIPHKTIAAQVEWVRRAPKETVVLWRGILHLDGLAHRYPGELSGGEQQRAALLRALAADRPVLLLDEALSAVDRPHRQAIWEKLAAWWPAGRLLIFSTHDWDEAEQFGQQLLYVEKGLLFPPMARSAIRPLTAQMAQLMGFLGVVATPEGPVLLHPRLIRPTLAGEGFPLPGHLVVEPRGPLSSRYWFTPQGQDRTFEWNGPAAEEGQFNGLTLTRVVPGESQWEG